MKKATRNLLVAFFVLLKDSSLNTKIPIIFLGFVEPKRIHAYQTRFKFKAKKENLNGLQLADLVAYPIARHILEPKRINLPFDLISKKFDVKNGKRYGLKEFP